MTSRLSEATCPDIPEDTLRLSCPDCGGGLNLKRRHLGITGQCVHCHSPLTAHEEDGLIRVITRAPAPTAFEHPVSHPSVEADKVREAAVRTNPSMWNFPERETTAPSPAAGEFEHAIQCDFSLPLPGRETGKLVVDRHDRPEVAIAPPLPSPEPSPFNNPTSFQTPFSSMFKNDDDSAEINPAWGTKVPQEIHASMSPFATGSAGGGGFAESLFREKVVKNASKDEVSSASSVAASGLKEQATPAPRASGEKIILDGDGRPMAPWTKAEEEEFAKNLFALENSHKRPQWLRRVIRFSVTAILLGGIGIGAYILTPEEKLTEWKTETYEWLEPGMAILDFLPKSLRPGGTDSNGNPRTMNALEGLEKLTGEVKEFRGAAEEELRQLNDTGKIEN